MRILALTLGTLLLAAAAPAGAQATDFKPLMDLTQTVWPKADHIGVVADYDVSAPEIERMSKVCHASLITVVNIHSRTYIEKAWRVMSDKVKPDFVVLLANDQAVPSGFPGTTRMITMLAQNGIATIGTTREAIRQGALFALGEGTGMEVEVAPKIYGTVEVILPKRGKFILADSSPTKPAKLNVVNVEEQEPK